MKCIHRELKEQLGTVGAIYRYSKWELWSFIMYRLTLRSCRMAARSRKQQKSKSTDFSLKKSPCHRFLFHVEFPYVKIFLSLDLFIFLDKLLGHPFPCNFPSSKWSFFQEMYKTRSCPYQSAVVSLGNSPTSSQNFQCCYESWETDYWITALAFTGSSRNYRYTKNVI